MVIRYGNEFETKENMGMFTLFPVLARVTLALSLTNY